jgi:membrane protein
MARLPGRALWVIRRGIESMVDTAGTREAAQVAFFTLLTFPAALLLGVWGASSALDDPGVRSDIVDGIVDVLPLTDSEGRSEVESLLDGVASGAGTLGLLGAVVLILSASGAVGALRHSTNAAWPVGEPLPYFPGKVLDVALTLFVLPVGLAALALNLIDVVPSTLGDDPLLEGAVSVALTQVVPAIASFGVFLVLYRVLPAAGASWRAAWPGALVAFLGVALVRVGTELYFRTIGDAAAIYGAIAGLLAVSISVYLLAIVAVLGANVSAQAARYPSWRAVGEAMEADPGSGNSVWADIRGIVKSLFVRQR